MLDMQVIGLTVDSAKMPAVVLQEASGEEVLSIPVAALEAVTLSLALNNNAPDGAMTHDLLLAILKNRGCSLLAVEITALRQGVYAVSLVLATDDAVQRVDCRPSDGMILALRAAAPLRIHRQVLRDAAASRLVPETPREPEAPPLRRLDVSLPGSRPAAPLPKKNDETEDRQLADLLNKLEPESPRKM